MPAYDSRILVDACKKNYCSRKQAKNSEYCSKCEESGGRNLVTSSGIDDGWRRR